MRVLLAIPTRNRPMMLATALASVARAPAPPGVAIEALVIDNASDPEQARAVAAAVGTAAGPHPARVVREPRLGIPFARNRALDAARAGGFDAVVFLDDDQTVAESFFAALIAAAREEAADVVKPLVRWEFDPPGRYREAFEGRPEPADAPARSPIRTHVATNGVFVSRRVWGDLGLSFDERWPLVGGEDTDYFFRASAAGARMLTTRETFATERCPAAKQTRLWLLRRAVRVGNGEALRRVKGYGTLRYALSGLLQAVYYAVAAAATAWSARRRRRCADRCAKALGTTLGALGVSVDEYRRTVGR